MGEWDKEEREENKQNKVLTQVLRCEKKNSEKKRMPVGKITGTQEKYT